MPVRSYWRIIRVVLGGKIYSSEDEDNMAPAIWQLHLILLDPEFTDRTIELMLIPFLSHILIHDKAKSIIPGDRPGISFGLTTLSLLTHTSLDI